MAAIVKTGDQATILDLEQVSGIDVSAWSMLQRLVADCDNKDVTLLIAGLERLTASEPPKLSRQLTAMRFANVREAIEHVEEALLRAAVALHQLIARDMARCLTRTTALLRELGY